MSSMPVVFQLQNVSNGTYQIVTSSNNSMINFSGNNFANVENHRVLLPISNDVIPQLGNKPNETDNAFNFEIVYPEDLNLKRNPQIKRGRPKKKVKVLIKDESSEPMKKNKDLIDPPVKAARTRSGRLIKLPKYIEKDFKKIEIKEEDDLVTSEFVRIEDNEKEVKRENIALELHQKKRIISSQFRCPKCQKAYMGKMKMLEHLKKYPDHGPLPDGFNKSNFDVWNYLVDVTKKCPSSERGAKFCEELTNLLHNIQLLTNALFRNVINDNEKNLVEVDKVLGNAIGLEPGQYSFNDNELYKDVTVLQLITNTDFFKPNKNSVVSKTNQKEEQDLKICLKDKKFNEKLNCKSINDFKLNSKDVVSDADIYFNKTSEDNNLIQTNNINNSESSFMKSMNNFESNLLESSKSESSEQNNRNLLLSSPTNIRNSVDDLMLTAVDTTSNLLDNSTSSDEVMNVDQFVNERFKKITEPDIELNGSSLNLELPSLELFHFHTN